MTVSNANPVQFWAGTDDTYNETAVCSVEPVYWCQPWHCEDTINLQVEDPTFIAERLLIAGLDDDGNLLIWDEFSEIADHVFQVDVILQELCGESVQFFIFPYTFASFVIEASSWSDILPFDSKSANEFDIHLPTHLSGVFAQVSQPFTPFATTENSPVFVRMTVVVSGTFTGSITLTVASDAFGAGSVSVDLSTAGTYDIDDSFLLPGSASILLLTLQGIIESGSADVSITIHPGDLLEYAQALFKSDCQEVGCQDCTTLITYSNSNNFIDIDYSDISPTREFTLRVPAVFFEEDFPEEYESIDLSTNEIVQLTSQVKHRKLLDVGWMPFYMIQKLKLILAHDNVEIDDMRWIKQDGVQITSGNKRYPLRKSQAWLTDKDFLERNVL